MLPVVISGKSHLMVVINHSSFRKTFGVTRRINVDTNFAPHLYPCDKTGIPFHFL